MEGQLQQHQLKAPFMTTEIPHISVIWTKAAKGFHVHRVCQEYCQNHHSMKMVANPSCFMTACENRYRRSKKQSKAKAEQPYYWEHEHRHMYSGLTAFKHSQDRRSVTLVAWANGNKEGIHHSHAPIIIHSPPFLAKGATVLETATIEPARATGQLVGNKMVDERLLSQLNLLEQQDNWLETKLARARGQLVGNKTVDERDCCCNWTCTGNNKMVDERDCWHN